MLDPLIENAYKVLDGEMLTRAEALALAEKIEGEDILDLVSLANKVRHKFGVRYDNAVPHPCEGSKVNEIVIMRSWIRRHQGELK